MQPRSELVQRLEQPAIDVRQLRKTYTGGVEAVKGIDFQVVAGEVFGLLGPNGAGKSTTIGMLTTTIAPTSGSARVAGFDVAREPLAARRVSSVVFQDPVVDRALTGRRNLDIHARLWRVDPGAARSRISELAQTLGLAELLDRPVAGYSGGERRRLEIARALVSQPEVLFLDEPTVGLDPRIRHELLEVIGRLRDRSQITSCSPPTTSTKPSGSATGSRSSTPARSSHSRRPVLCWPASDTSSSSCA
jgi:ABC-2 type transport system ATP-binding protein